MLNLLFISSHPKADALKNALQPMLKVRIDVVTDFDHGLKDVFEIRPTIVCIQDQISGVTGESVARHIQMLLGTGAPSFILLHDGNPKIKPLKGLYENLIDLSLANAKLLEEILTALKSVMGDQWEKIYIAPKQNMAAAVAAVTLPEGEREVANQLVDDFLSDLKSIDDDGTFEPPTPGQMTSGKEEPFEIISSSDELAAMLVESAQNYTAPALLSDSADNATVEKPPKQPDVPKPEAKKPQENVPQPKKNLPQILEPPPETPPPAAEAPQRKQKTPAPPSTAASKPDTAPPVITNKPAPADTQQVSLQKDAPDGKPDKNKPPVVPTPAEFTIKTPPASTSPPAGEHEPIPDDLLLAFEENYRSRSSLSRRITITVIVLLIAVGGAVWYLAKNRPEMLSFLPKAMQIARPSTSQATPKNGSVTSQPKVVQNVSSSVKKPAETKSAQIPSFVPVTGRDASYSANNPGWERYIGSTFECRVFKGEGRIRALQILSVKGQAIPDKLVRTALLELVGTAEYAITSKAEKQGFLVKRGTSGRKADLIIYTRQSIIFGFVVSIN